MHIYNIPSLSLRFSSGDDYKAHDFCDENLVNRGYSMDENEGFYRKHFPSSIEQQWKETPEVRKENPSKPMPKEYSDEGVPYFKGPALPSPYLNGDFADRQPPRRREYGGIGSHSADLYDTNDNLKQPTARKTIDSYDDNVFNYKVDAPDRSHGLGTSSAYSRDKQEVDYQKQYGLGGTQLSRYSAVYHPSNMDHVFGYTTPQKRESYIDQDSYGGDASENYDDEYEDFHKEEEWETPLEHIQQVPDIDLNQDPYNRRGHSSVYQNSRNSNRNPSYDLQQEYKPTPDYDQPLTRPTSRVSRDDYRPRGLERYDEDDYHVEDDYTEDRIDYSKKYVTERRYNHNEYANSNLDKRRLSFKQGPKVLDHRHEERLDPVAASEKVEDTNNDFAAFSIDGNGFNRPYQSAIEKFHMEHKPFFGLLSNNNKNNKPKIKTNFNKKGWIYDIEKPIPYFGLLPKTNEDYMSPPEQRRGYRSAENHPLQTNNKLTVSHIQTDSYEDTPSPQPTGNPYWLEQTSKKSVATKAENVPYHGLLKPNDQVRDPIGKAEYDSRLKRHEARPKRVYKPKLLATSYDHHAIMDSMLSGYNKDFKVKFRSPRDTA